MKLIDLQNTQFGAIGRPENPLFGAEIFVMFYIQAELNTNFLLVFSNFCYHGNTGGSSKIRMTPFDWLTAKTPSLVQKMWDLC